MGIKLEDLDPKFREQTDLLLLTNKQNLDLNNFILLLQNNYENNLKYFLDRFVKSCDVFWENNAEIWYYRLSFIFSLKDKNISNRVSSFFEKRMSKLCHRKFCISPLYDVEFLQYQVLCQIKKDRNENLGFAFKLLEELPSFFKVENTIGVVNQFIPTIYSSIEEYAENISKKINNSSKNFIMLKALDQYGISYNRKWIIELSNNLLLEKSLSDKNKGLFFALLSDIEVLNGLKEKYSSLHKKKLISLLNHCDLHLFESAHLNNIKNIITLDPSITDNLVKIYVNKLYARQYSHRRSNADKLIRLINKVNSISPRLVLSYLSSKNKMSDVKYMLKYFPEVKNLAAFL